MYLGIFFFKHKTAYEMRISDWSSDVCSSDLVARKLHIQANIEAARVTFEKVAREWHEANAPQWAKVHAAEVIRTLERDVFPAIGSLPIGALNPPKILEVLRAIEARSAIETAKRHRPRNSAIHAYAIHSSHAGAEPTCET